jgi:predicted hydrocarbon binding protein
LEEALTWVTGGHSFHMEEIECRALGAASCSFAIDKDAID